MRTSLVELRGLQQVTALNGGEECLFPMGEGADFNPS
jgi:hypothetical protein